MFKNMRLLVAAALTFVCAVASAQITTSTLSGKVTDSEKEAIIGATVQAIHTPSGTSYGTITNIDGRYTIQGMRAGGPYKVTISYVGYQTAVYEDITLALGETYVLNHEVQESSELLDEVVISATASKFSTAKTGAATNISNVQMATLPTVNRSIEDVARMSPYANGMSFAGGDGRSTNFTVDGANFNNNFGLSDKLPSGGNPISVDAIEEIQVVIAPFDVRQSNFIGGGINAITKSGTNTVKGTAYTYYHNQALNGRKINGETISVPDEEKKIYGFTLGGPIIKNKLFYFVNFESQKTPKQVINYRANKGGEEATGNVSRTLASDMKTVQDYMKSKYGYDTGSYTDFPGGNNNMKILARIDWNINDNNKLSARYNLTKNTEWKTPNDNSSDNGYRLNGTKRVGNESMAFAYNMYSQSSDVQTFSLDLNSRFNEKWSNQLLATYTDIFDGRGSNSAPFPHVDLIMQDASGAWKPYMSLGYELFTWNNGVQNRTYTVKDDVTYMTGNHKVTFGASYEHQFANNAYMRDGTMYYRYLIQGGYNDTDNSAAILAALNGTPESFAITYGWGGEKNPTAQVTFNQIGAYAQDEWDMSKNFKLTYGIRIDDLLFDNGDLRTNNTILAYDFRDDQKVDTGAWPTNRLQFSPRVGFVWDVNGDQTFKVRGGTGLFQGRLPLVYFTNMPTNSDMFQKTKYMLQTVWAGGQPTSEYNSYLDLFNGGMVTDLSEFLADPEKYGTPYDLPEDSHPKASTMTGVDKNFHMPQVWKSSIAADWKLPTSFPMTITAEAIFNKTIYGVMIDNINIVGEEEMNSWERFAGADNRLIYPADKGYINPGVNAPVLVNTNKGYGYTGNITITGQPTKDLNLMAAYTYTESKEVSGLPGSDPISTWQGVIDVDGPQKATVQRSQYVVPNKVIASVSWMPLHYKNMADKGLRLNLFYTGMSAYGNSFCYTNDMNGDGINNDLMYIPTEAEANDPSKMGWKSDADKQAYLAFAKQDNYLSKHAGEYAEAYAARAPWVHRFDFRATEDFAFKCGKTTHNFQASIDIMNIGNMFNSKWGVYKNNSICNANRVLNYEGKDASNVPTFSFMTNAAGDVISQSYDYYMNYSQCWNIQLGLKYIFN